MLVFAILWIHPHHTMYAKMRRFGALVLVFSTALAQTDLSTVLAQFPTCTVRCKPPFLSSDRQFVG
jgi:hypothetical protein